jgi:hypothetical protein
MSTSFTPDELDQDEDEKNTNAQLIAELKEQVQRAEQASEQYRKQVEDMQRRLDDATNDQTASEERDFQRQTEIDHLRAEIKESVRQRRELELAHDSEKRLLLQDRDRQSSREAELQSVIRRLNETLRNKGLEKSNANRACKPSFTRPAAAPVNQYTASVPVPAIPTDDSDPTGPADTTDNYLPMLREKDAVIESMRLELAELQFKAAEHEHMGDGRLQILEKQVLETKMQNARLLEENESFQMLLSEKTLKGDFAPEPQDSTGLNTLAEELESFGDDPEAQSEAYKRLEAENKQLKESGKALTLYIDKIIGRILQHEGFEHIIVDKDHKETPPPPPAKPVPVALAEKALPAPPSSVHENAILPPAATVQSAAAGFLQRAKSVVSRSNTGRPSRPMSYAQPVAPTANENPDTAPSIPLNRGHRRARSDQAQQDLGAAAVVQQMNRGSPLRSVSGGPMSPGMSPLSPQHSAKPGYFPTLSQSATRAPSNSHQGGGRGSSRNSITSEHSQELSSTDASSAQMGIPPASTGPGPSIPGAVMKQNQLRPLRLVQEQSREDEEAQKRANRGSWMGWLRGSAIEAHNEENTK